MNLKLQSSGAKGDNFSRAKYDELMPTPGEIIKAAIKRAKPKTTQRELASKLNVSESAVSQWVNDHTIPERVNVPALCDALRIDPGEMDRAIYARESEITGQLLLTPEWQARISKDAARARSAAAAGTSPSVLADRNDVPVWASALAGDEDGTIILTDQPIDYLRRSEDMLGVVSPFAFHIIGDSMEDRLYSGDQVVVNPSLPPLAISDCVFIYTAEDGVIYALVKRLLRSAADHWRVRQLNPRKDFDLPKKKWAKAYRIAEIKVRK